MAAEVTMLFLEHSSKCVLHTYRFWYSCHIPHENYHSCYPEANRSRHDGPATWEPLQQVNISSVPALITIEHTMTLPYQQSCGPHPVPTLNTGKRIGISLRRNLIRSFICL